MSLLSKGLRSWSFKQDSRHAHINGKHYKISRTKAPLWLNLGNNIVEVRSTKFVQMVKSRLTFDFYGKVKFASLYICMRKMSKNDFRNMH